MNENLSVDRESRTHDSNAWWRHTVPFVAWLFLMQMLGDPAGWKYAVRAAISLLLFIRLRPWVYYERMRARDIRSAVVLGIFTFFVWIAPESLWCKRNFPTIADFYLRWCILPAGKIPSYEFTSAYDPRVAGWLWAILRLAGSAGVIAVIEEFFWRGFIYRWLQAPNFTLVGLDRWDVRAAILSCVVFGLEHDRWFVGAVAGGIFLYAMLRRRNIWCAVIAHVIANLVLGIYVLAFRRFEFW